MTTAVLAFIGFIVADLIWDWIKFTLFFNLRQRRPKCYTQSKPLQLK